MDEWAWIDSLAEALGDPPVDRGEIGAMLRLSRDVAHRVERKLAPVSAFVVGRYVGRRVAEGAGPDEALAEALRTAGRLVPDQSLG